MSDKIFLLYFIVFVCAMFTFVWWIEVKKEKEQIFKLFTYLLYTEGIVYASGLFFVLDNPLSALVLFTITVLSVTTVAILAKKCDDLSDELITMSTVLKSEPRWLADLRSSRRAIIILSAVLMACFLASIDAWTIFFVTGEKIANLFVNCTIIVSAMIISTLIFAVIHNEASTELRLKTAC